MPGGGRDRLRGRRANGHDAHGVPESGFERVRGSGPEQAARPLVGTAGAGRGDRPGRAVVVHHLRGVRGAVPGRHRARRPHRRHAPPPGADRVGVPLRAGGAVPQPGEQGQPVGAERPQPPGLDQEARLRGPRSSTASSRREMEYLFWIGCAGAFDDGAQKTVQATAELLHRAGRRLRGARPGGDLHRRPGPALGQRVPVPDARPAERRGAQRACSRAASRAPARSSPPARTASTPWAGSTRSSTGTTRSCTTRSCSTSWCARASSCRSRRPTTASAGHLPRPVLPRAAQRDLRRPARAGRRRGRAPVGDAAPRRPLDVLRRGRRAHVDGGAHRAAGQRQPHRRGPRHPRATRRGSRARSRSAARSAAPCSPTASPRPKAQARARTSRSRTSPRCCWPRSNAVRTRRPDQQGRKRLTK